MQDATIATPSPTLTLRANPAVTQKTIVITGAPRGGTSFLASIVSGLGVPFRGANHQLNLRFESENFVAKWKTNRALYEQSAREMDAQFDTWAVKHPRATDDLPAAASAFRNPFFIFAFKEPLSVSMRASTISGRGDPEAVTASIRKVLRRYQTVIQFAVSSPAPCLLVSYDMALRNPSSAIDEIAAFIGVREYDRDAIAASMQTDRALYFDAEIIQRWRRSSNWKVRTVGTIAAGLIGRR